MTKTKTASDSPGQSDPFPPILELQKAGFGTLMGANAAWLESLGDMSAEVTRFIADRVQQDVTTQREILACDDMAEVQKIQTDFMQKAIAQYQAETGKLVEMSMAAFGSKDTKET